MTRFLSTFESACCRCRCMRVLDIVVVLELLLCEREPGKASKNKCIYEIMKVSRVLFRLYLLSLESARIISLRALFLRHYCRQFKCH